jgi:type I restriction enzyme M protein
MAKKATKKQEVSLETIMDNCRNVLRGAVGGNEKNRDTVMGLVFLKFVGDKFEKRREEIIQEYGNIEVFLEPVHNLFNNKAMKARLVN